MIRFVSMRMERKRRERRGQEGWYAKERKNNRYNPCEILRLRVEIMNLKEKAEERCSTR